MPSGSLPDKHIYNCSIFKKLSVVTVYICAYEGKQRDRDRVGEHVCHSVESNSGVGSPSPLSEAAGSHSAVQYLQATWLTSFWVFS